MQIIFLFWLVIACLFLIAEVGHPGLFFFLPFSLAAFVTAMVSAWDPTFIVQGICFLSTAAFSFLVLHRWLKVRALVAHGDQHTNIDALIGKQGVVTKAINEQGTGYVKINGEEWLARTTDNSSLAQGIRVSIVAARGAHLIVKKLQ